MVEQTTCKKCFNISQYFLLFVPLLAVYLPTVAYPVTNAIGSNVPFRPPGYVFAIVWPILLILLGISWFIVRAGGKLVNSVYTVLVILLGIWFILYDNNKYIGLADIIVSLLLTLYLSFNNYKKFNKYSSITLIPLIIWLLFASVLNVAAIIYT